MWLCLSCVFVLFCFVCLLVPFPAFADESAAAKSVISDNEILLEDGRLLRLKNIKAATPEAKGFLESAVLDRSLVLKDVANDRYRRVTATVFAQGQTTSIEELFLSEGLAFVYPFLDEESLESFSKIVRRARLSKSGFWAEFKAVPPEEAETLDGKYGFVAGTVMKVERIKNKVILSFGTQARIAFTVVVAARYLKPLKKRGLDLVLSEGKSVLVRGGITTDVTPSIIVSSSYQLELAE